MASNRIAALRAFIEQRPNDPFPRYALALEYKNGGDLEAAQAMFAALMQDVPSYTATYLHAGNVLIALGRRDEARAVYQRGVEVCTQHGDAHARGELEGALAELA